jgi:GDPmannose 4,6-dehydratase
MKKAFITGITGQDGSYLAEFLLEKGYEVHGLVRRTSTLERPRITHVYRNARDKAPNLTLHYGDMTDGSSLLRILSLVKPDEIYNLAAQSHVHVSFEIPEYTGLTDAIGVLKLIETVKLLGLNTKIYQASTSELFGEALEKPQKETTPFNPRSPYALAKQYAYGIVKYHREAFNMFACNGILFNHESPRRGENFVTRKISLAVAKISRGLNEKVIIGNLDSSRDWGFAPDYVEAMWLMLQQDKPEDYVIATGETHTVREFIEEAFRIIGTNIEWSGSGKEERGVCTATGKTLVEVDPSYFRPLEVNYLLGDSTKARTQLAWKPKVNFKELVKIMVEYDIKEIRKKSILAELDW